MMAEISNREIGDIWTGYILGVLFEKHPKSIDLVYKSTYEFTGVYPNDDDPEEMWRDLIDWLVREGFIRFKDEQIGTEQELIYSGVSLTLKGYHTLGATPAHLSEHKSVGERLVAIVSKVSSETASSQLGMVTSELFKSLLG
jgi:hypothetical protein